MFTLALLLAAGPIAQKPIVEINFEMVGNRIYLPAKLNGRNLSAIFDTGAGASAVDLGLADELKIPGDQRIQAGGVGTAQVFGRVLNGADLELGDQKHVIPYAIPFASLNGSEGRKLELILGHDFINRYLFEVDYASKTMRIHAPGTKPKDAGTEIPIRFINGHPHIRSRITFGGKTHDVETMIDSGASGGGLTGRFTKVVPIPASVKTTSSTVIGGGVGGFVSGRFLRLDSVDLGGIKVQNPIASVNEAGGGANGANASYDYLLGAEILKRFTFTIDYPNKRVFFKPNADFGRPFEADKTGLRLLSSGPDFRAFTIVGTLPGSTSDLAGLKSGDKLVSIDGVPATAKTLQEWRDHLRNSTAKAWEFIVDRNGSQLKVRVESKPVI
ncbi:MAG: aspartyl protease family protein [Chlorobia bacterium]|nr:aspartyl protease family protein [Fimbriimonadaceae bacterium]